MADPYLYQQVRLENLKEGEAREIAKLLRAVHEDLLRKLPMATTDWSRERYTNLIAQYSQAIEQVYTGKILPKLDADGLQFTTKNLAYQYEALLDEVTGTTAGQRMVAAKAMGLDVDNPVYRGANTSKDLAAGTYFAKDPGYTDFYAGTLSDDFPDIRPQAGKYYIPKEGVIDFNKDAKVRAEFSKWYVADYRGRNPATNQTDKEILGALRFAGKSLRESGVEHLPFYQEVPVVEAWLKETKRPWSAIKLYEGDARKGVSNITYLTRTPDTAVSAYSDLTLANARRRAAIAQGFDVDTPLYRGVNFGKGLAGEYYAFEPAYASTYAKTAYEEAAVFKVYLPKEGALQLSKDTAIREAFFKEFADDVYVGNIAKITERTPLQVREKLRADYFNKDGELRYLMANDFKGWAAKNNVKWTSIVIDEDNGHLARFTNGDNVAKSAFDDFGVKAAYPEKTLLNKALPNPFDNFKGEDVTRAIRDAKAYKSKSIIIKMTPQEFLDMARPGFDTNKAATAAKFTEYNSLPSLRFEMNEKTGVAQLYGHEGRHRARELIKRGVPEMPVVLEGNIRWDQQLDPKLFDYMENFPKTLLSETGEKKIPFPVAQGETGVTFPEGGGSKPPAGAPPAAAGTPPGDGLPEARVRMSAGIVSNNLSPEAVYVAATAKPMQGRLMTEWASQLSRKDVALVSNALRTSWVEGEAIGVAAKRLAPILSQSKNGLMAITRTYYGHLASEARSAVWQANSDIIEGQTWDAMLDARTTINICAPRDGLKYTLQGVPVKHSLPWLGGPGQAHWNCRSTARPSIVGVKRQVDRQAIEAGPNYKPGDKLTRGGKVRKNVKDSRERGLLKETTVSPNTRYSEWLRNQSPEYRRDILGVQKEKAFMDGSFKLGDKFVAHNPTTIGGY